MGSTLSLRQGLHDRRVPPPRPLARADLRADAESDRVARSWFEPNLRALARFVERDDPWMGSAALSYAALTLTRAELEQLGAEYIALVRR